MLSPLNKKSTDDVMHQAAMKTLQKWMESFEKLPPFGGEAVFNDVYEWMKAQNPQYWSSHEKRTPQLGDIFCAYLIVVGVCEQYDITTALALLNDPKLTIRDNGQTKEYWNEKLQKHLAIHSVEFEYSEVDTEAMGLRVEHYRDSVREKWSDLSDSEKIEFLCATAGLDLDQIDVENFDFSILENLGKYSSDYNSNDHGVVISDKRQKSTSETLQ